MHVANSTVCSRGMAIVFPGGLHVIIVSGDNYRHSDATVRYYRCSVNRGGECTQGEKYEH